MTISPFALVKRFAREERGASLVEYAVLIGLVTALLVTAITLLGTNIQLAFNNIATVVGNSAAGVGG
jgi:pilus assembly protein Flp/PilA